MTILWLAAVPMYCLVGYIFGGYMSVGRERGLLTLLGAILFGLTWPLWILIIFISSLL